MSPSKHLNRRQFLIRTSLGASAIGLGVHKLAADPIFSHPTQESPGEPINIGMIAVGARAQQLIENILLVPGTRITAVCDAYTGRVERAIARTGGTAKDYQNYQAILDDKNIDAVVISTPDHLHKQQVVDAIEAGKHVYIEKPMTYTVDEGLEVIKAAESKKVAVQVGSTGMSSVLSKKAKELIASGKIGQVTMIRAQYNRNTAGGAWIYPIPPDASPETVNWEMFLGSAPKRKFDLERFFRWRCYEDYSGGISTDLFVHLCTSIHYIMGVEMCSSAVAMGGLYRWRDSRDVPDTINASLAYPEGFMASISTTFNNQSGSEKGIHFLGTEGSLSLAGGELIYLPENVSENNAWIVRSWPEKLEQAYYADPDIKKEEQTWTNEPSVIEGGETWIAEGIDATTMHFHDFINAVRSGKPTSQDARAGHYAASCAHMVNQSISDQKMIHWDKNKMKLKS